MSLDVEAAASYINMSAKWIYKHLDSVPHLRIGDGYKPRIRFRRRDLDHWLLRAQHGPQVNML